MEILKLIKNKSINSVLTSVRRHKNLKEELLTLTSHIVGHKQLPNKELLYIYINNLEDTPKCECGTKLDFIKFGKGYKVTCGKKICVDTISTKKRKITNNKKYGGNSPSCSKDVVTKMRNTVKNRYGVDKIFDIPNVKEKTIQTNLEKYGVEWSSQNTDIKNKVKNTNLEKYGTTCTQLNGVIKNKTIKTNIERYGTTHVWGSPLIREKIKDTFKMKYGGHPLTNQTIKDAIKNTSLIKYGTPHPTQNKDVASKISTTKISNWLDGMQMGDLNFKFVDEDGYYVLFCDEKGEDYKIHPVTYNRRKRNNEVLSVYLNPLHKSISKGEEELHEFIKEHYRGETISNDRTLLNGREIGILIPELKLGIEYNGLYWHSSELKPKKYHQNKYLKMIEKGYKLIQIWEDEWNDKPYLVKSYLKNVLNVSNKRVYARKCVVKELTPKEYENFCVDNHLQGSARAKIKLGLTHNEELVSVMSFGTPRNKINNIEYEMIRFCNKLNVNIIGGVGKLFKHFLKTHSPTSIVTYSDLDKFDGNTYLKLGFKYDKITEPSFFWFDGNVRENRFKYRKPTNNLIKVFNSGNKRFIWVN